MRQIQKGSRSNDILGQTVKNFAATESAIANTAQQVLYVHRPKCLVNF